MYLVIFAVVRALSSLSLVTLWLYDLSFTKPPKKKSKGLRSWEKETTIFSASSFSSTWEIHVETVTDNASKINTWTHQLKTGTVVQLRKSILFQHTDDTVMPINTSGEVTFCLPLKKTGFKKFSRSKICAQVCRNLRSKLLSRAVSLWTNWNLYGFWIHSLQQLHGQSFTASLTLHLLGSSTSSEFVWKPAKQDSYLRNIFYVTKQNVFSTLPLSLNRLVPSPNALLIRWSHTIFTLNWNNIVPWWRYLLGITDSATQSFTHLYYRLQPGITIVTSHCVQSGL
jgi:hypothetical protein